LVEKQKAIGPRDLSHCRYAAESGNGKKTKSGEKEGEICHFRYKRQQELRRWTRKTHFPTRAEPNSGKKKNVYDRKDAEEGKTKQPYIWDKLAVDEDTTGAWKKGKEGKDLGFHSGQRRTQENPKSVPSRRKPGTKMKREKKGRSS